MDLWEEISEWSEDIAICGAAGKATRANADQAGAIEEARTTAAGFSQPPAPIEDVEESCLFASPR